jgi:hypothetical protein
MQSEAAVLISRWYQLALCARMVIHSCCWCIVMPAAQVCHLLDTAILRSHRPLISSLVKLPAAAELSQRQLCQPLRTAVLLEDQEVPAMRQGVVIGGTPGVVQQLCNSVPWQQGVSCTDALLPLLRLAVGQGNRHNAVRHLCLLPAAAVHITGEQLGQLLQLGMQTGAAGLQQLAVLATAVQEMPAAAVGALLSRAVQQQGAAAVGVVQCLSGCPAVRQLSTGSVLQLIRVAVQSSNAAQSSNSAVLQEQGNAEDSTPQLLRALFSGQMGSSFQAVLGAEAMVQAATMALNAGQCGAAMLLCRGKAAHQIPLVEASELLQLAASTAYSEADDRSIESMVECLPSLQQLEPQQLQELLAAVIRSSCSSTAARLLQMPAVPWMDGCCLMQCARC